MFLSLIEARALADRIQLQIDSGAIEAALAEVRAAVPRASGEARAVLQHVQAMAFNVGGRSLDALHSAAESLEGFRRVGSRVGELDALLTVAGVLRTAGDHGTAIETLEDAEAIARSLDDATRIGLVLRQIGICCSIIGRHQQALSSLREAAALHDGSSSPRDRLNTMLSLYNAHNRHALSLPDGAPERQRDLAEHLDRWSDLASEAAAGGLTRIELMALGNHAITLHDVGRHRDALDGLTRLLPRYREHGMLPNEAICYFEMGRACESLGELEDARGHYEESIRRFDVNGASGEMRDALEGLANVLEAMGDFRAALAALRRVRGIEADLDESAAHRTASQRELRLELARVGSHWQRLASIDPLTGLANRRALDQWFVDAQTRTDSKESLTVLLHDLDHFKSINDRFGHPVGDDVLRQVATLIHANCRPNDLAVRYGGEEFLLAMAGIDTQAAAEVAERLRASVEAHRWDGIAPGLSVTVSVGIAGILESGDTAALLTLADRRLYAAKHAGRNRVVSTN